MDIICTTEQQVAGSQPPTGYVAWPAWAGVQHKAGLRQARCARRYKWRFPQEPCHKESVCPA